VTTLHEFTVPTGLPDFIQDHVRTYLESGGSEGHMWDSAVAGGPGPVPTLLLVTTGRRSGNSQTLPLIYGRTETGYVVVASKGGSPGHPAWYLNLAADAEVSVQIASERFSATARTADGPERESLWRMMASLFPPYDTYQGRTERQIPVVVLEPDGS
jgi:deazaflavin-dependent oxidoreductase (nitroreductase family)